MKSGTSTHDKKPGSTDASGTGPFNRGLGQDHPECTLRKGNRFTRWSLSRIRKVRHASQVLLKNKTHGTGTSKNRKETPGRGTVAWSEPRLVIIQLMVDGRAQLVDLIERPDVLLGWKARLWDGPKGNRREYHNPEQSPWSDTQPQLLRGVTKIHQSDSSAPLSQLHQHACSLQTCRIEPAADVIAQLVDLPQCEDAHCSANQARNGLH